MKYQNFIGNQITKISTELEKNIEKLDRLGYFVVPSVIEDKVISKISLKMDQIKSDQENEFGINFLKKIGDKGVLRTMFSYDKSFYDLIVNEEILKHVHSIIGEFAILHLQNGIVLENQIEHNQSKFHRDFPKDFIASKILSINAFIAIDEFNHQNGGTWVIPGSHKHEEMPSLEYINENKIQIKCPKGSILFFDSLLWHAGGSNFTKKPRRAINQQYTRPFIKQQIDLTKLIDINEIAGNETLTKTLGFWSIPPSSINEYRVDDPSKRTYRKGNN